MSDDQNKGERVYKYDHLVKTQFKPGNPGGRLHGARHKFAQPFLDDIHEAWQERGKEVIQRVINRRPDVFLRVVAQLLPKDVNLRLPDGDSLSVDEMLERIRTINAEYSIISPPRDAGAVKANGKANGKDTGSVEPH